MGLKKFVGVTLGVALLGFVGYKVYEKTKNDSEEKAKSGSFAVAIDAVDVIIKDVKDMRLFTGSLEPVSEYNVSSKVGGYWIEQSNINIGEKIKPNAFIGKIEDTEFVQDYEQAKANYDVTKAELEESKSIFELRRREYQRQLDLSRITSKAELETAEFAEKSQAASVKVKEAELTRQAAILKIAKIRLDDTVIRNLVQDPNSRCYIAEKRVELGDLIAPNQVIVKVVDISKLNAKINVTEKDYPNLSIGQKAELSTDAYPNQVFTGSIKHIAKSLNKSSRQAEVEIIVDNQDVILKPGMFARVYLEFAEHKNAQMVPRNAIVKIDGKDGLFYLDLENEEARFVYVEIGVSLNDEVEIMEPKNLDKPIITLGNHLLVDRNKVIVPEQYKSKKTTD